MHTVKFLGKISAIVSLIALPAFAQTASLTVTAVNHLQTARASETIELTAAQLAPLDERDLNKIHVADANGKELVVQAVDSDFNEYHVPNLLIFQSDFAAGETKTFTLTIGAKHEYAPADYKAYGRFVRERFDDYAWENDRIAHRTFGKALETWKGEPLAGSSIDIWAKRVPHLVIDEWYMAGHYHHDSGEGCDDYSSGATRGDGGDGLWAADRLWVSRNFVNSRTFAAGPIRVEFELEYEPFEVNGISVSEVRRISLDAGHNLDHYQVFYTPYFRPEKPVRLTAGLGLKKVKEEQLSFNPTNGTMTAWQKMEKQPGSEGVALVISDPQKIVKQTEDKQNDLVLSSLTTNNLADYWAGFAWDQTGQVADAAAWQKYVDDFAAGLQSPIEVSVSEK